MTDHESDPLKIPIEIMGQEAIIDLSNPSMVHYRASDDSSFADKCWEKCNPEGLIGFVGSQAAAEFCMMNAMQGGGGGEQVIEITAICSGSKRRFFKKVCGAEVSVSAVSLPFDESHPEANETGSSDTN
jgi:hypothetical protein